MSNLVWPSVTPISRSVEEARGQAWGTGNYVRFHGADYVLTNAHVIEDAEGSHLGHLPGSTNEFARLGPDYQTEGWPLDVGLTRLIHGFDPATRVAIAASQLDRTYSPVQGELLFVLGFPGSTATRHEALTDFNKRYTWFGGPMTNAGIPVLTTEFANPPADLPSYDSEKHVVVHFPAKAPKQPGGPPEDLPNPKGMSGSLLWDTKFMACYNAGRLWTPDQPKVCGLVWAAHHKPEVIVATKIEHLRPMLVDFLRHERAYFHWIDRGKPLREELVDWTWAEQTITDLT